MNYNFDELVDVTGNLLSLDFSREALPTLNESSLDENAGLPTSMYANIFVPHSYQDEDGETHVRHLLLGASTHDWNNDGSIDSDVQVDLNWFPEDHTFASEPSEDRSMKGVDEWPLLLYAVPPPSEGGGAGGCAGGDCVCKLTEQLGECAGPGTCAADLTGDGNVGVADLLQLIGAWGECT